jgi:hypothetical protein
LGYVDDEGVHTGWCCRSNIATTRSWNTTRPRGTASIQHFRTQGKLAALDGTREWVGIIEKKIQIASGNNEKYLLDEGRAHTARKNE